MPLPEPFKAIVNVLVVILIVAIIVFYGIIPLLQALAHLGPLRLR